MMAVVFVIIGYIIVSVVTRGRLAFKWTLLIGFVIASFMWSGYTNVKNTFNKAKNTVEDAVQDTVQQVVGDVFQSSQSSEEDEEEFSEEAEVFSSTTYFVLDTDERPTIIIFEPDGTCAYFTRYATSDMYHYGTYEKRAGGVILHITLSNTGEEVKLPLSMNRDTLVSNFNGYGLIYPGEVFNLSSDVPPDVLSHPPYQASDIPVNITIQQAIVMLDEYIMTIPNAEAQDIEYLGIISVNGRNYYQFSVPLFERFDEDGDRFVVDVLSCEMGAIHLDDGSEFSNAFMDIEDWFWGAYAGNPWTGEINEIIP